MVLVITDDHSMNEMDKQHEVAIASAEAFSRNITEGATGVILADVEVEVFHHKTRNQQQEYEEFLRRNKERFIRELLGSKEEPEPKRMPRGCAVCGSEGPWYLVCDKCEVSPVELERRIQRTSEKVHTLAFCEGCGHHGEMGFLCVKCDDRVSTYTFDGTDGWRPRVIRYNTDSEIGDYKPTEYQNDMECKDPIQDMETEVREPWDRVYAYCADCGERGDVSLPRGTCDRHEPNNGSGYLSQEEGYSNQEEHRREQLFTNCVDEHATGTNLISQKEDVGDRGVTYLSSDVISGVRLIRCQNGEGENPDQVL